MMRKMYIAILLLLVSTAALAGTDCRIEDKGDHVELICVGDEKFSPAPAVGPRQSPQAAVVPRDTRPAQSAISASNDQPGAIAPSYSAVRSFHGYVNKDQQRVSEVLDKRAYRQRMIQEEQRRTSQTPEPQQPMLLDQ